MRMLIAEDDLTSRTVLTAVLSKLGHEIVVTNDGQQAWLALQRPDAPRLLVLDWMMPELDGVALCRRVRTLPTEQPPYIIMLTALGDKSHIATALDAGANDYLIKPFDHIELRARVAVAQRTLTLQEALVQEAEKLREALVQVKTLRGIIPICCFCKRIRDDQAYWRRVEEYVSAHTGAVFSHALCPECAARYYPEEASK